MFRRFPRSRFLGFAIAIAIGVAGALTPACAELRSSDVPADAALADGTADGPTDAGPSPFEVVRVFAEGDQLTSIWGADDKSLFVVGTRGIRLTLLDGEWTRAENEPGRNYYQVWGTRYEDVYAVGEIVGTHKGIIQHWDGRQWSDEYVVTGDANHRVMGIHAPTPIYGVYSDGAVVLAASTQGRLYGKGVGTTDWAERDRIVDPEPSNLLAITGNGGTNLTLMSDRRVYHTTTLRYWSWLEPAVDVTTRFGSAWAPPGKETDVYFGTNYLGVVWMYAPGHTPAGPVSRARAPSSSSSATWGASTSSTRSPATSPASRHPSLIV